LAEFPSESSDDDGWFLPVVPDADQQVRDVHVAGRHDQRPISAELQCSQWALALMQYLSDKTHRAGFIYSTHQLLSLWGMAHVEADQEDSIRHVLTWGLQALYYAGNNVDLKSLLKRLPAEDARDWVATCFLEPVLAACATVQNQDTPGTVRMLRAIGNLERLVFLYPKLKSDVRVTRILLNSNHVLLRQAAVSLESLHHQPDVFAAALYSFRFNQIGPPVELQRVRALLLNKQNQLLVAIVTLQLTDATLRHVQAKLQAIVPSLLELQTLEAHWMQCAVRPELSELADWITRANHSDERAYWAELQQQELAVSTDCVDDFPDKSVNALAIGLVKHLETQAALGQTGLDALIQVLDSLALALSALKLFETNAAMERLVLRVRHCEALAKSEWSFFQFFLFHATVVDESFVRKLDDVLALLTMSRQNFGSHVATLLAKLDRYAAGDVFMMEWGPLLLHNLGFLKTSCPLLAEAAARTYSEITTQLEPWITNEQGECCRYLRKLDWRISSLEVEMQRHDKSWFRVFEKFQRHGIAPCLADSETSILLIWDQEKTKMLKSAAEQTSRRDTMTIQQSTVELKQVALYVCKMYALFKYFQSSPRISQFGLECVYATLKAFASSSAALEDELMLLDHLGCTVVNDLPHFKESRAKRLQEVMVTETHRETLRRMAAANEMAAEEITALDLAFQKFTMVFEKAFIEHSVTDLVKILHASIIRGDGPQTMQRFPEILGNICAVWAQLTSKTFKHVIQRPHNAQVFAMMRLLGVGRAGPHATADDQTEKMQDESSPDENSTKMFLAEDIASHIPRHLAQVNTGEGKSLVLAVVACVFALCGNFVDVACYSSYLSRRDAVAFHGLFSALKIQGKVTYSTIKELCYTILKTQMDLRQIALNVVKGNVQMVKSVPAEKRILLLDEVDVFCGANFCGMSYNPATCIRRKDLIKPVLNRMWDLHRQGFFETVENQQDFLKSAAQDQVLNRLYSPVFINATLTLALKCLQEELKTHSYAVLQDEIVYSELDGAYSREKFYSYHTVWAGFQERDNGRISEADSYLYLPCGNVSYAAIPGFSYSWIGGLSGTLHLTPQEEAILHKYQIREKTIMPTIFTAKKQVFDPLENVRVVDCAATWCEVIAQEVQSASSSPRPILVYFEDREALDTFLASPHGTPFAKDSTVTLLVEGSYLPPYYELNPTSKVFALRAFGRGVDFVCPDVQVNERGGVHVVQTFLSSVVEQVQIQGRTARQAKDGTFELIVNYALAEDDLPPAGLVAAIADRRLAYAVLNQIRTKDEEAEAFQRAGQLEAAELAHQQTMLFIEAGQEYCRTGEESAREQALGFIVKFLAAK
jgi:hypothetical protein